MKKGFALIFGRLKKTDHLRVVALRENAAVAVRKLADVTVPVQIVRKLENNLMDWKKADDPPEASPGTWSREVIVLSNYGDVFQLKYFGNKEIGFWQKPARFNKGEEVAWWIDKPE